MKKTVITIIAAVISSLAFSAQASDMYFDGASAFEDFDASSYSVEMTHSATSNRLYGYEEDYGGISTTLVDGSSSEVSEFAVFTEKQPRQPDEELMRILDWE